MLQALLLAIWAGLCTWDQFGPHLGFRKPLLASVGVGIILGDMTTAIMIGATMELMWLGVNNIGAYVPPDVISGTIVGAALGIMGSTDTASAIALAVAIGIPTATLVQQLNILVMTTNVSLVHGADKAIESGKFNAVNKFFWTGALCFFLTRAVPVFIATGIGSFVIEDIMAFLQNQVPWVLTGFSTAGGMMPAVGLAMLLTMMMKKNMWIFLCIGFVLFGYMGVPTLGCAIIGIALVMLIMIVRYRLNGVVASWALCIYTIVLFWVLAVFPGIQLTLPGIAGIVLGIGMAVDANVVIFERFNEEVRAGRSLKVALKTGFHNALSAIIDANVTTIIAAIVLMIFGTGSVQGFAKTLLLGVIVSLFSALLVTRFLMKQFIQLKNWNVSAFTSGVQSAKEAK